jgi:polyisoprenoid-binding protein YceI
MILFFLTVMSFAEILLFDETKGKLVFEMKASLHDIEGQAQQFLVELDVGPGSTNTGKVTLSANQLTTFLDVRDDRMYNEVLQVDKFPVVTYTILSINGATDGLNSGQGKGKVTLRGTLNIASIEREVDIPVAYMWTNDGTLKLAGKTQIRWTDFGLPDPSIMISTLYPPMDIKFSITSNNKK